LIFKSLKSISQLIPFSQSLIHFWFITLMPFSVMRRNQQ